MLIKILLSAYACEPNEGSEPGVGWHWAHEIEKLGHQVWVFTRSNNKRSIENFYQQNTKPEGIDFIYYDLPGWLSFWKKGRRGVHLYYLLWQVGAYRLAKELHKQILFDCVHHITFVSARQPSFMGMLNIPFIFGPVAGGESIPKQLRGGMTFKERVFEKIRDVVNTFVKYDPLMNLTFSKATQIYATSEQTKALLPYKYQANTKIQLAIGVDSTGHEVVHRKNSGGLKILFVGNFLYLKGMHYGLVAFKKLLEKSPNSRLTLVGRGQGKILLQNLAIKLGIQDKLDWVKWVGQHELGEIYTSHDVLLFPSLRDSGGMVVLEALSYGLPVICLGLGGPGLIVDGSCGRTIKAKGHTEAEVVRALGEALIELSRSAENLNVLAEGALKRSDTMSWSSLVETVYNEVARGHQ